jgi:hypothetical protein
VAALLPPFRAEREWARIAEEQGNVTEARARLIAARRLLDRARDVPRPVAERAAASLERALRQLPPP